MNPRTRIVNFKTQIANLNKPKQPAPKGLHTIYANTSPNIYWLSDLRVSFRPMGQPGSIRNLLDYASMKEIAASRCLEHARINGPLRAYKPKVAPVQEEKAPIAPQPEQKATIEPKIKKHKIPSVSENNPSPKPRKTKAVKDDSWRKDIAIDPAFCKFVKEKSRKQCKARPLKDGEYCSVHSFKMELSREDPVAGMEDNQ